MAGEELAARLASLLAREPDVDAGAVTWERSDGGAWARLTVDVPVQAWRAAARAARDDSQLACDFFDWLSAVDETSDGIAVLAHVWSIRHRHGLLLRTRLTDRPVPAVASIVDLYPGAAWHERETHEMFGIDFPGHPGLTPLLLAPQFEGHPLRKDFVLASRVAKSWPGTKEPGEGEHGAARRAPMRPLGVPEPGTWGPDARPGNASADADPGPDPGGG